MAMLDQLKLTETLPKKDITPLGRFRRRLTDALDLQMEIAKADRAGESLNRTRKRWVKNEAGSRELREIPLRLRRWWWKDEAGTTYLGLKHGARLLEIAPGKKAVEVGAIDDLPGKLMILRDAARAGELDGCYLASKGPSEKAGKKKEPLGKGAAKGTKRAEEGLEQHP